MLQPVDTLLVVDAMTRDQEAVLTAAFDSAVGITGAIFNQIGW
jgi:signal recognition particle GTPase